ncbi:MAG: glycosyltransferase [Candidatus Omnitrophota bacterium]
MKIIHTPTRFLPYIGGVEQVALYECKELIKRGHRVRVICADEPKTGSGTIEGVKVKRLAFIGKIANTNITLSLGFNLLAESFDIIHTHLPTPWNADISAIVSFLKRKPLFLSYQNDIVGRGFNGLIAGVYNLAPLKLLLKRSYKIFLSTPGYADKSGFLKAFKDKLVVAPLGVDTDKFSPAQVEKDSNEKIIFFLSRLDNFHRYKGLDYLLDALKTSAFKIPVKLYVGGDGELLDYYKQMASDKGLKERVVFLGFVSDSDIVKYFNLCDVFTLPSISSSQEGFGLVALEALACAKAVVVSEAAGVAEDVKKHTCGVIVKPKDSNALANALSFVLENDSKSIQMGIRGRRMVMDEYSWKSHVDIIEREYKKAY